MNFPWYFGCSEGENDPGSSIVSLIVSKFVYIVCDIGLSPQTRRHAQSAGGCTGLSYYNWCFLVNAAAGHKEGGYANIIKVESWSTVLAGLYQSLTETSPLCFRKLVKTPNLEDIEKHLAKSDSLRAARAHSIANSLSWVHGAPSLVL